MATVSVPVYGEVHIPGWVTDHGSFRRWVHSGVLPEKLAVHFIAGEVWVDFHMEEAFSHNLVKTAITVTLGRLVDEQESGDLFSDHMLLTNEGAGLSTEPDVLYVSYKSLRAGRVTFTAGETTGAVATEMLGSPDVVVEIVSPSSEDKDTEKLMTQYHDAGVREYWLIDARGTDLRFDTLRRRAKGYAAARRDAGGWARSVAFGRAFRLTRRAGPQGHPRYRLEVR